MGAAITRDKRKLLARSSCLGCSRAIWHGGHAWGQLLTNVLLRRHDWKEGIPSLFTASQ